MILRATVQEITKSLFWNVERFIQRLACCRLTATRAFLNPGQKIQAKAGDAKIQNNYLGL
jgi:hypothetical protein